MIVITCPVDLATIKEFNYEDDIAQVVRDHMAVEHLDWFETNKLNWFPRDGAHCPMCAMVVRNERGMNTHVSSAHPQYKKVDTLRYELKEPTNG